ncbi:hypothetical protein FRC02_010516 [Tulasnella sp. 418]|nr:hypothetical protein FRC02_010516 [Tulasnella sp. 418]
MISRTLVVRQARVSIDRAPLLNLRSSVHSNRQHLTIYGEQSSYAVRRRMYSLPAEEPNATAQKIIRDELVHSNGGGTNGTRKVKVGLHPAPKKVGLEPRGLPTSTTSSIPNPPERPKHAETSSINSQSTESLPDSTVSTSSTPSTEPSTTHQSNSHTFKSASAIQLAIEDMRKAAQHGILKPPPEDAGRIRKTFHQAKELFKFYFRGIKMLWLHRKTVIEIKSRLAQEGPSVPMTRWEMQFIRTYEKDMVKLVPFILILLILEEILPLVVLYMPGLLPSTCILPSQLERIESKAEDDRKVAIASVKQWLAQNNFQSNLDDIRQVDTSLVKEICRVLALSSKGTVAMARARIERHLSYLSQDDALLQREGNAKHLSERDLRVALSERGFLTKQLEEVELRPRLVGWLSDGGGINTLLDRLRQS